MTSGWERLKEAVRAALSIAEEAEAERDALLAKVEADRKLIEEAAKALGSGSYFGLDELRRLQARLTASLNEERTDNG
jgi:hypothetical protein